MEMLVHVCHYFIAGFGEYNYRVHTVHAAIIYLIALYLNCSQPNVSIGIIWNLQFYSLLCQ